MGWRFLDLQRSSEMKVSSSVDTVRIKGITLEQKSLFVIGAPFPVKKVAE